MAVPRDGFFSGTPADCRTPGNGRGLSHDGSLFSGKEGPDASRITALQSTRKEKPQPKPRFVELFCKMLRYILYRLCLSRCSYWTYTSASAAIDACILIDNVWCSLGNSLYWTSGCTSATSDAIITDSVCHWSLPPCVILRQQDYNSGFSLCKVKTGRLAFTSISL